MGAKLDSGVGPKRGVADINAEPNVIPFIDVMLVLLIIFMVTAPIAAVDIKTEMPVSEVETSKRPNKPVWITVIDGKDCFNPLQGGQATVKGKPVTNCPAYFVMEEEVRQENIGVEAKKALIQNNPKIDPEDIGELGKISVYVRASGETEFKNVMRIMNRVQDQGLYRVSLVASDMTP
jgi:biopolymer transport protein ExbD